MLKLTIKVALLLIITGCAKEKAFEKANRTQDLEFKDQHQLKSKINSICGDINDPCLYLPSVANTPYKVSASRPYWQGDAKIVISKLTQDKLKFLEVGNSKDFRENTNNLTPVFSLGVSHLDYKCAKDEYGDCTNKEVIDDKKVWSKRKYIKINLDSFKVVEVNSLPIQFGELFNKGCFTEVNKDINDFDVSNKTINLTVKVTYKTSVSCADYIKEWKDIRYLVFNVDYKYSIAKLSSLADKSYKAVDYPSIDQGHFGFFTTNHKKTTVDYQDNVTGLNSSLLNRWSPNKKEITYYLNSDFYTEEMKDVKKATINAIRSVNIGLEMSNAKIKIKLKKGSDKDIGDLRKNFIILVPEPQASGVIGYGPSVANPLTGEILNARTVMYLGTIKKYIGRAWDEIVDAQKNKNVKAKLISSPTNLSNISSFAGLENYVMLDKKLLKHINKKNNHFKKLFNRANFDFLKDTRSHAGSLSLQEVLRNDQQEFTDFIGNSSLNKIMDESNALEKKYEQMAKETFFHASFMNFEDAVKSVIENTQIAGRRLPYWADLTEKDRANLMKQLLPIVWIPTLVHEFGHNLGLRHNFMGSVDKSKFLTKNESRSMGLETIPQYSSIMDYAYRNSNELSFLGKYDIAALQFAYARQIQIKGNRVYTLKDFYEIPYVDANGETKFKKEPGTLETVYSIKGIGDQLKQYKENYLYCTDEHVPSSILCNRHDEGTTRLEVAQHYINSYNNYYEKRNFRLRKYDMNSRYEDFSYLLRIMNRFQVIRQFFDEYDMYASNDSYDGEDWKKNPLLVDVKNASDKSFDFFMSVIEEPGYHCVEIDKATKKVTRVAPFAKMAKGTQLEDYGITFDIRYGCLFLNQLGDRTKIYAEFGKYINNSLDLTINRSSIVQTDRSQIDVRGVWLDKVMANFLTSLRITSPSTIGAAPAGNYLDYPDYRTRFEKYMTGLTENSFEKDVILTFPNGAKAKLNASYSFDDLYKINQSFNYGINYVMNLTKSRTDLKTIMMRWFKSSLALNTDGELAVDDSIYNQYHVERLPTHVSSSYYSFDQYAEFYRPGKKEESKNIIYRFGINSENTKALELKKVLSAIQFLDKQDKDKIIEAIISLDAGTTGPSVAAAGSEEELLNKIKSFGKKLLNNYIEGVINQQSILTSFLALSETGDF